jgi:GTP-binding protein Era
MRIADILTNMRRSKPVILALNKVDAAQNILEHQKEYEKLFPSAEVIPISARNGLHCDKLLEILIEKLPLSEALYESDQVTDLYEREIAGDLIREACLKLLKEEVPHSLAVRVDEYKERSEELAYISATLLVDRESHKSIVIGKGGTMLKDIGSLARQEIEAMGGRKIYLELRVKVQKNWRDDPQALKVLGYTLKREKRK